MKKLFLALVALLLIVPAFGCSSKEPEAIDPVKVYGSDTLSVMNWGEYIGEDVIENFEKKFNVKVNYNTYDSNELLYTKLVFDDSYDVVVPADYMLDRMIKEDMLQPLDYSYMTNLSEVNETALQILKEIDKDAKYSLPYFIATAGIAYDKSKVSLEDLQKEEWAILKDSRYAGDIYMYDSERDAFMIALKDLGYSANTENDDEINAANKWLIELHDTMNPSYVTDEVIDGMITVQKALAVVYSGDAVYITSENDNVGFYLPKSGARIAVDGLVIPKNAKNPKLANEFINFVIGYESALDSTLTVGYTSTNDKVLAEVTGEGGDYQGNEAYMFDLENPNSEIFLDIVKLRETLSEMWIKIKYR